jgi:hypothetical protein
MNLLTVFGWFAVTTMLAVYAVEKRSPWYILGFAISGVLGSIYGSCKRGGDSGWSRESGQSWRRGAGGAHEAVTG